MDLIKIQFLAKKLDKKIGTLKSAVDVTKHKIYFKNLNNKKIPLFSMGKKKYIF